MQAVLPRFVFTRHVPSLECVPYTADMTFIPNCNDFEICSKCLLKLFTFRYRNVISYMKSRQNQPCFRWVRGIRSRSFLGAYLTTLYYRDYRSRQQSVLGRALSLLPRKPGLWVPIPLGAWMCVCIYSVFLLSCVGSSLMPCLIIHPRNPNELEQARGHSPSKWQKNFHILAQISASFNLITEVGSLGSAECQHPPTSNSLVAYHEECWCALTGNFSK